MSGIGWLALDWKKGEYFTLGLGGGLRRGGGRPLYRGQGCRLQRSFLEAPGCTLQDFFKVFLIVFLPQAITHVLNTAEGQDEGIKDPFFR